MKIVILHGLYMHGLVMQPLAQRLNKLGYQTEVISYNTLAIDDEKVFQAIDCALAQDRIKIAGNCHNGWVASLEHCVSDFAQSYSVVQECVMARSRLPRLKSQE